MAKQSKDLVNKSEAIRKAIKSNPKAKPKAIAEKLNAEGIDVSAAYVSTIKTTTKKKRKSGRGTAGRTTAAPSRSSGETISIDTLVEAKHLAQRLGGIAQAKQALDALAKLQN